MADVTRKVPEEGDLEKSEEGVKGKTTVVEELCEEDMLLQINLDGCIDALTDQSPQVYNQALILLSTLIRSSTTTMTSVPKPLKFLRKHYNTLKAVLETMKDPGDQQFCADVISVLAMTCPEGRDCLNYKLKGRDQEDIGFWGHEYVRHLSGEIAQDWNEEGEEALTGEVRQRRRAELLKLAEKIIPYNLNHNAEAEACDLAMEIEHLELLEGRVDQDSHLRVCAYLASCVPFVPDPENLELLRTVLRIFKNFGDWPSAVRVAMQLNDSNMVAEILRDCPDEGIRKQLAFMIGRQRIRIDIPSEMPGQEELTEIATNELLYANFLALGRELDILEPKTPDEVYKTHLDEPRRTVRGEVESARLNLAASFVSGFVNAGFGRDKLLSEGGHKWLYKNREHGMMSAAASLGLVLLWDVLGGLNEINRYLLSVEDHIKAGALLACGIVNCGVRSDIDPALALLRDYINNPSQTIKIGSILGLGLAYTGTDRGEVITLLRAIVSNSDSLVSLEVVGLAGLACGLVAVGTANPSVTETLITCLMEKSEAELKEIVAWYVALGIGLTYLGKQEQVETVLLALEVLPDPFKSMATTFVEVCAFTGTGNVLKIQHLLHICSEHYEPPKEEDPDAPKDDEGGNTKIDLSSQQSVAVLGIALIAMGEDIGTEMAFRSLGQLLRYGEPVIRKAVPLALALLSASNPRLNVLDTLNKFSHDVDGEVALNSIFAMGIVAAGTNNARVAVMLRQLALYYARDSNKLFMVRIAQGLVHLGKGTLTLSPFHSDRQLLCPSGLAGLLSTLFAFLDVRGTILGHGHYMLFCLATAMNPRMLATFDENLQPLPVSVRVGQALDTVGVAGNPKTITGFQTYTTPVLLSHGERAELATNEYTALSPILEGFVVLRKNTEASN